ncbi:MAG TPA: hypothetical protein VGC85_00720 [Chthoniobacterales bacterium]
MNSSSLQRLFSIAVAAFAIRGASACDLCGCYTPQIETLPQASDEAVFGQPAGGAATTASWLHGVYFAVAEQFTHFGTLQIEGDEVANPSGQYLDSSITQLVAGYSLTAHFALQLNVPLIYRSFERPEGFAIDRGTEAGLGDVSLVAKLVLLHKEWGGARSVDFSDTKNPRMQTHEPDVTFSALVIGGVKLPTGSASRIKEEFNEVETPGAPLSGIHGHDLTLGTGSYDGIIGGQMSLRYHRFFAEADLQYTVRGEGAYGYEFADDISWNGGPGFYFMRSRSALVGVQVAVSGEHKDVDRFRGQPAEDTGITSVFLGPRLLASLGRTSAELGIDVPVSIDNTALQAVPDYRVRAAFSYHF